MDTAEQRIQNTNELLSLLAPTRKTI